MKKVVDTGKVKIWRLGSWNKQIWLVLFNHQVSFVLKKMLRVLLQHEVLILLSLYPVRYHLDNSPFSWLQSVFIYITENLRGDGTAQELRAQGLGAEANPVARLTQVFQMLE